MSNVHNFLCLIRRSKYSKTRQDSEEEKHLNPGRLHTDGFLFFSSLSPMHQHTSCAHTAKLIYIAYAAVTQLILVTLLCIPPSPPSPQGSKSTWIRSPMKTPIRPSTSLPRRLMLAVFTLRGLLAWVSLAFLLTHTYTQNNQHTHADLALTLLFALCV